MKSRRWWVAGWLAGALMAPALAAAGVDEWVRLCKQDNGSAWCEQQGRKLLAASHIEAAAAFNINSGFARFFTREYGTLPSSVRLRPGQPPPRGSVELSPADQERVRTPEGLRMYLGERAGKGNARADFLFAGASKGAERLQWIQRSANAGDADAMYVLGNMYANGLDGLRRDDALAFQWTSKAAAAGNAAAMGVQARILAARGGPGTAQALDLAKKGCERGAQSACIVLADLTLAALDAAEVTPEERSAIVKRALDLYTGVLLKDSRGFSLEPERQAALYSLAQIYVEGKYVPADKAEARGDLVRALNVEGAMLTDAWMVFAEENLAGPEGVYGFPKDTAKGLEILRRFTDMGDVGATVSLGLLLLGGRDDVPADVPTARALLKRSAATGDSVAMTALARSFTAEKNDVEAFGWLQQAVNAGNPHAHYLIATSYQKGLGTEVNENAYRASLRKACDLDYLQACLDAGNRMVLGTEGFPPDRNGGVALLEKARAAGSAEASWSLGTLKLRESRIDDQAKQQEAMALLVEAGKRGSKEADEFLARIAGGDNAILQAALARAKGEPVPEQLSVQEAMMRSLQAPATR